MKDSKQQILSQANIKYQKYFGKSENYFNYTEFFGPNEVRIDGWMEKDQLKLIIELMGEIEEQFKELNNDKF